MTETSDAAKKVMRAFYESYNKKDLNASFDAYISPELVNHAMGGMYDRAAWIAADMTWFPAFGDFSVTVMDQVAEGGKVATRYKIGGTQTGEFFGVAPRGNTVYMTGTSFDRVENGLVVEHWADFDFTAFLQQLSADPS